MHEHIRDREEIPNDGKHLIFQFCYAEAHKYYWHCTFAMPKHTNVILWLTGNSCEMIIYAFFLGFLVPFVKKSDTSVKYKRQLNLTHHKQRATKFTCLVVHRDAHLSYKRYKIKKTLFQWPPKVHKYQCTYNTHCFCIFLIFQIIFLIFIWKTK